jgi:hypothetical protein
MGRTGRWTEAGVKIAPFRVLWFLVVAFAALSRNGWAQSPDTNVPPGLSIRLGISRLDLSQEYATLDHRIMGRSDHRGSASVVRLGYVAYAHRSDFTDTSTSIVNVWEGSI